MHAYRTHARIIGILFIVASLAAIVGGSLLLPAVGGEYLADAAAADTQVATGVVGELVLAAAVVGIAVTFHPVLRRESDALALGYVAARTMEAVVVGLSATGALLLLELSREHGPDGDVGVAVLGGNLLALREWTYWLATLLFFGAGAVILYTLLYRARLVPVWLSLWGLVAAVLLLVRALLELYGVDLSGLAQGLLAAPIGVNEMVLALWLIIKGFSDEPGRPAAPV